MQRVFSLQSLPFFPQRNETFPRKKHTRQLHVLTCDWLSSPTCGSQFPGVSVSPATEATAERPLMEYQPDGPTLITDLTPTPGMENLPFNTP